MIDNLNNIKTAEVFYARHITHGISKYKNGNVLITKPVLDKMNPTFSGKPVVITHDDWKNQEPVGYVVKSFYLPQDGYFWIEFVIFNINALSLIKNKKFRVSNGYITTSSGVGGKYHDIDYVEEVLDGEYIHLALTDRPKFDEAIILNQEEFQSFKKSLEKIENKFNEKEDKTMSFFRKQKVDNSEEILNTSFELGGKDYTVGKMIEMLKEKLNEGEKKYTTCTGEYTAEELVEKYNAQCETIKKNEEDKQKQAEADAKAKADAEAKAKADAEEKAKQNEKLNARLNANSKTEPKQQIIIQSTTDGRITIKEGE